MANRFFNHTRHLAGTAGIDYDAAIAAGYLKVLFVKTSFDMDTYKDETNLGDMDLGTHEFNGANYIRRTILNAAWVKDAVNDRSELTADPTVWASLGAADLPVGAAIVYIDHVSDDDDDRLPLAYVDDGGWPFDPVGNDNTVSWDAEGVLQHA